MSLGLILVTGKGASGGGSSPSAWVNHPPIPGMLSICRIVFSEIAREPLSICRTKAPSLSPRRRPKAVRSPCVRRSIAFDNSSRRCSAISSSFMTITLTVAHAPCGWCLVLRKYSLFLTVDHCLPLRTMVTGPQAIAYSDLFKTCFTLLRLQLGTRLWI